MYLGLIIDTSYQTSRLTYILTIQYSILYIFLKKHCLDQQWFYLFHFLTTLSSIARSIVTLVLGVSLTSAFIDVQNQWSTKACPNHFIISVIIKKKWYCIWLNLRGSEILGGFSNSEFWLIIFVCLLIADFFWVFLIDYILIWVSLCNKSIYFITYN